MRAFINSKKFKIVFYTLFSFVGFIFLIPKIYFLYIGHEQSKPISTINTEFPVSVFPEKKIIVENAAADVFLSSPKSPFTASVIGVSNTFKKVLAYVATAFSGSEWYQNIGFAGGTRLVNIAPGLRKEQIATAFGSSLNWKPVDKNNFINNKDASSTLITEGSYAPGEYVVELGMRPEKVKELINKKFADDVLSHYGTTTEKIVPLKTALIVASLIEKETISGENARIVSGIIWNRIFLNMNLQLDATLQYAKATEASSKVWWPPVFSKDKNIKSPYNTYAHPGLPPTPIANPSVASIIAALNPVKTTCLFYFNDDNGDFYCSDTYKEHVAMLKKVFGQGK